MKQDGDCAVLEDLDGFASYLRMYVVDHLAVVRRYSALLILCET